MAINSFDVPGDKSIPKASANSFKPGTGNVSSCRLVKIDFATEGSICSAVSKRGKKKTSSKSPYLNSDNANFTQVTDNTFLKKRGTEFHSSFPLAVNIYKASSGEFKSIKKANKKAKKSVLTLPNDQAPLPQICTVSDMNDSEYFNQDDRKKLKKRNPVPRNRKSRPKRDYEYYDRDARYINLDCSSTDMIQDYNGDKKLSGKSKSIVGYNNKQTDEKPNPHDVWAVLRNINRFQFRPSPPMSEDSFITPKKKKGSKRRNHRNDMRVVETCRTEEFAYISSFEVDGRSPHSFSKSSSFDRITVIDKQDDFSNLCKEFEKRIVSTKNFVKGVSNKQQNRNKKLTANNRNITKANTKCLTQKSNSPKALEYSSNSKKQFNDNIGDTTNHNKIMKNRDSPVVDKSVLDNTNETNDNTFSNEINGEDIIDQEFIYSGNSGSSKAAEKFSEVTKSRVPGRTKFDNVSDFYNPFNGITKVILSKGLTIPTPKKPELPKRKRQAAINPSRPVLPKSTINTVIPKLTQTDIKRRIAKFKFPIVVLGKDQLSSTYEVPDLEPIQFDGLNKEIWPFMVQWQNGAKAMPEDTLKTKFDNSQKNKFSPEILEYNKTLKMNRGFISTKPSNIDKKTINDSKTKNVSKVEQKRITLPAELQQQALPKKSKPIRQFKEKMLKLLYKNSSIQSVAGENYKTGEYSDLKHKISSRITSNKVDASTDTRIIRTSTKDVPRNLTNSPVKIAKHVPNTAAKQVPNTAKQPWAKARWASDFIDNVIRKIKTGVYYTHETKQLNKKKSLECKEAEIQTIAMNTEAGPIVNSISKITIKKKPEPITIPGFDNNSLPALEIKTMNSNEISVKHCVTNIMVHFDVTVPNEPVINLKRSSSLIPLNVTESQTKIFKCKTSIINAMLPAELCSILPKMMWNIIELGQASALPLAPAITTVSQLSIISENTRCESPEPVKCTSLFPHLTMNPDLQNIINGCYSNASVPKPDRVNMRSPKHNINLAEELLPRLSRSKLFNFEAKQSFLLEHKNKKKPDVTIVAKTKCKTMLNTCTALQLYSASDRKLVPVYKRFDFTSFQKLGNYLSDNLSSCSSIFHSFFDNNITINLTMTNKQGLENQLTINVGRLMSTPFERISKATDKTINATYKRELQAIQCIELKPPSKKNDQIQPSMNNKTTKKGFIKLYRKCKSTSNISAEKSSTSLSKITCLDEFFQALGTPKMFSGVFDNIYNHKIISSIKEMKSWITDINPTQALLVLLLMNKKDTPNLVRFRPVLLQGIAVNRITRANELDMEIEVIEREHLNRLTQYGEISCLPESAENQDNLLEELCWIAKTTASDYQRTFDESSEKLLKSLLEKRKKLNPSYLRVMARYVGLGLLKSPIKK